MLCLTNCSGVCKISLDLGHCRFILEAISIDSCLDDHDALLSACLTYYT